MTHNKGSSGTTLLTHIQTLHYTYHYISYTTKILKNATVQTRFCTSCYD